MKRRCGNCPTLLSRTNTGDHCFACQRKISAAQPVVDFEPIKPRRAATPEREPAPEPTAAGILYVITINGRPTTAFQAMYSRKLKAESALRSYRPVVSDRAHYKIIKYRLTGN